MTQLLKGNLQELDYPYTSSDFENKPVNDIIVFIVGGATYQEAREIAQMNTENMSIILGSTTMHNSKSFLGDLTYYGCITGEIMPSFLKGAGN